VHQAARNGAAIIVLPELCTGGCVLHDKREALFVAQPKEGTYSAAFQATATAYGCYIVFGYVEFFNNKLYNSACVVGPMGIVANVQKHNLWASDHLWAQASEQLHPVVITPLGRMGVLIGGDVKNEDRDSYSFKNDDHRFYKKGSVDVVAHPTAWMGQRFPDDDWISLAESLDANVIVSGRVGSERGNKFRGGSCIVMRDGNVVTAGTSLVDETIVTCGALP